jgi:hypothetical protein
VIKLITLKISKSSMKQSKDLPRFQPDPQFLVRLDQKLHQEGKQNHHQPIWSITALVASIALLIWIFPNRIDTPANEISMSQELVFLQDHFEDSEENLEILSGKLNNDFEELEDEDELIEELKLIN